MIKHNLDLFAGSKLLLKDADVVVTFPNKYGLVGYNGTGKSTLLKYISNTFRELDVYYVDQDLVDNTNTSIKHILLNSNRNRAEMKEIISKMEENIENLSNDELLKYNELLEKYKEFDKDDSTVSKILHGLGFTNEQQELSLNNFSGGWRMRVSIARGLFMNSKYLLLDEPTNHLDLAGVIWLTNYLKKWKNSLVIVSHDKYFIDEVCDNIIHLVDMKLNYYNHGYVGFREILAQQETNLVKEYKKQQKEIKILKRKNWSNEDILKKFGKILELPKRYKINIFFPDPGQVKNRVITMEDVSFSFDDKIILKNIDLAIDGDTRIALVGKNGVGKTTLLKLLYGKLQPTGGEVIKDSRNRIYYYDQFSSSNMDDNFTMIEYISKIEPSLKIEDIRKLLGTIGFESNIHNQKISALSGGQKMKLQFIPINIIKPHLLLLDEPTNNLDMESIESLINGINKFQGSVMVITHSVDLIKGINAGVKLIHDFKISDIDFEDYCDSIINDFAS